MQSKRVKFTLEIFLKKSKKTALEASKINNYTFTPPNCIIIHYF